MIDDLFYSTILYIEETARSAHKAWGIVRLLIISSNIGWIYEEFERKLEEAVQVLENLLKTILYFYVEYAQ